jgi:hypothetical protein
LGLVLAVAEGLGEATGLGLGLSDAAGVAETAGLVGAGEALGETDGLGRMVAAGDAAGLADGLAVAPSTTRVFGVLWGLATAALGLAVAGLPVGRTVEFNPPAATIFDKGSRKARIKMVRPRINRTTTRKVTDMPEEARPVEERERAGLGFLRAEVAMPHISAEPGRFDSRLMGTYDGN